MSRCSGEHSLRFDLKSGDTICRAVPTKNRGSFSRELEIIFREESLDNFVLNDLKFLNKF